MPLNSNLVGKLFDSMELKEKVSAKTPNTSGDEKLETLRQKVTSSFVNGQWLCPEPLKKSPWIHQEASFADKPYWHNYESLGQWSGLPSEIRKQHLRDVAELFSKRGSELVEFEEALYAAPAETLLKEVLPFLVEYWQYYSGWAALEDPQNRQYYASGSVVIDVRQSKFPLLEASFAAAPALAAGCVITVLGHRRLESLLYLASLAKLPAGVFNVVVTNGPSNPPEAVIGRPVAVFGPIKTTKESDELFNSESTFYLRGRSNMLIMSHADFEGAARALLHETTKRANFSFWPVSEVLVQEHLYQPFVSYFQKLFPTEPINSKSWSDSAINKVRKFANDEGLKLLESSEAVILIGGRFEEPMLSEFVEDGPYVVGLLPVRSLNEAVTIVNSRPRILSASVWTQDGPLASQAASGIKAPIVWINQHGKLPSPSSGIGSTIYSGFGQWGGKNGLLNFKQWRPTVCDKGAHRFESKWSENADSSLRRLDMFVNGKILQAASAKVLIGRNEKPFATVGLPNNKEVSTAVSAGLKAFQSWSVFSQPSRADALEKLGTALAKSEVSYAKLLNDFGVEGDKIAACECKASIQALTKWCAKATTSQVLEGHIEGKCSTYPVPVGIVAVCGPIDSLSALISLITPALLAGNCVLVSASPRDALVALHLAQVGSALPAGVLNVVGPGAQADFAAHPEVGAVWVGFRDVTKLVSDRPKKVWRVDWACLDNCPDEYFVHNCTSCKSVFSAD
ncbi:aldehyde dehydrogenase family 16 member A1-like isoform X2 [Neocloeon triangulifer]|uniref:aldehyde dehydrogenase family 16 member A1-like isoform X2 n=1 Tax=Neocloeon triangulifer TaxID=2078957 RepID=UPI00286F2122|nr:aldehyde dehydrogenase family 16 member A1-like isoform X2 [Neocloeon triangulifer]